jgi:spoIIIJ-associated protein
MTGLLGKIFGGKKKGGSDVETLVDDVLKDLMDLTHLKLSFDLERKEDEIVVNFFGEDEELLTSKEGQLLDSMQLYIRRVVQHQMPDEKVHVNLDCANFRKDAEQALIELADKLKDIALTKGKPVYFRALPPKDRKVVHQYLAEDGRVKSRSVGDGHFKKIKIFPAKEQNMEKDDGATESR